MFFISCYSTIFWVVDSSNSLSQNIPSFLLAHPAKRGLACFFLKYSSSFFAPILECAESGWCANPDICSESSKSEPPVCCELVVWMRFSLHTFPATHKWHRQRRCDGVKAHNSAAGVTYRKARSKRTMALQTYLRGLLRRFIFFFIEYLLRLASWNASKSNVSHPN